MATSSGHQLDERLAKALSHPLRQRILEYLNTQGVSSPNEVATALGVRLTNLSYHVRILRELDCLELVRTEQRRGAIEHYYRATARPWLSDDEWAALPLSFRRKTLGRTVGQIFESASAAVTTGGFDAPDVHVSKVKLRLDEEAWRELGDILDGVLEGAIRLQAETVERDGAEDHPSTQLALMLFRGD